jgi:hypothetical protein
MKFTNGIINCIKAFFILSYLFTIENCQSQKNQVLPASIITITNVCLDKKLDIETCHGKYIAKFKLFSNYVIKIQYNPYKKREIVISILQIINNADIPINEIDYYYKYKNVNAFIIMVPTFNNNLLTQLIWDKPTIERAINSSLKIEEVSGEGVNENPIIAIFRMPYKVVHESTGRIQYEMIQPISKVEKDFWPIKVFHSSRYIQVDTIGMQPYGPWDYCKDYNLSEKGIIELQKGEILF